MEHADTLAINRHARHNPSPPRKRGSSAKPPQANFRICPLLSGKTEKGDAKTLLTPLVVSLASLSNHESPIAPSISPTGGSVSPIRQKWTLLDTFGHFLGVSNTNHPSPSRADGPSSQCIGHPPLSVPNRTEIDTFGHFFRGLPHRPPMQNKKLGSLGAQRPRPPRQAT